MLDAKTRVLWMGVRDGLLRIIEAIEIACEISPTTAEIRRKNKNN